MRSLQVEGLTVEYASGGYRVRPLDGLSFVVDPGSLAVVLGPSGSGKTSLLSCLAAILRPAAGSIRFGDLEVAGLGGAALVDYRRRSVGIVFQAFNLVPSLQASENVMMPLLAAGVPRRAARDRAEELLASVGLADRVAHRPGELSGGQQQRVAIARALALDPPLVLADEPTAHLDHIQVEQVLRLLRRLADEGRIVVVVTHDDRLLPLADHVIELVPHLADVEAAPEQVELAPGEVLFEQGSRGDRIYVVERGKIDIVRVRSDGGEDLVATIGREGHFGEMGPLFNLPRSATARARTPARVTGYTAADFARRFDVRHLGVVSGPS